MKGNRQGSLSRSIKRLFEPFSRVQKGSLPVENFSTGREPAGGTSAGGLCFAVGEGSGGFVVGGASDLLDELLHSRRHGVDVGVVVEVLAGDAEAAHVVGEALGNKNLAGVELLEYPAVHIQIVIEAGNDDAAGPGRGG